MLPIALTVFIAIAVAGLVACEARQWRGRGLACKTLASLGFIALALAQGALAHGQPARVVLAGLVLGACGDVALGVPGRLSFVIGLGFFLCGQVAYLVGFTMLVPPIAWPTLLALVPIAATVAVYLWLAPRVGPLRLPVLAYMTTSTLMVIGALAVLRAGTAPQGTFLLTGAGLFYLSDVFVARDRFVQRALFNRAVGLPIYYAAQILFAWTTGVG